MFDFNKINQNFPIRRTDEQKQKFIDYVKQNVKNYEVNVDTYEKKHNNVVIGDWQSAKVIFTAHYDTPASSFYPNLMLPKTPLLAILFHILIPILLALVAVFVTVCINMFAKMHYIGLVLITECIYFSLFYFGTRFFVNKHNANDNTSGVSTVLQICSKITSDKVAFILFDNEEKGLLGSKAFSKKNKQLLQDKLVINLDCVGDGENFIFICKPLAQNCELYAPLKNCEAFNHPSKKVYFYSTKESSANSDNKNFDCSIGIVACNRGKTGIFYTSKIHTNKDTTIDASNIEFLSNALAQFASEI